MVVLLLIASVLAAMLLASVLMSLASNRSAFAGAGLGAVAAPLVLAAAIGIAVMMTRAEQPFPRGAAPPVRRPAARTVDVLVINFDPLIHQSGGRPLHAVLGWNDPHTLAAGYAADVTRASGGAVRFRIGEWRDIDAIPPKADGYAYTPETYLRNHRAGGGWHEPDAMDYHAAIRELGIVDLLDRRGVDEVWFFGGPYFGFSEAAMAGPEAFDVNGVVLDDVPASKRFVIMGFNYERGVAEMLENLCHRVEATMSRVYGGWAAERLDHAWARFAANQAQSGTAAVGSCHWPPNAEHEYDFDNPRTVLSSAHTWRSYPSLADGRRPVNRDAWGGPDYARNYFRWWFAHLPRADGTGRDGREHNWWKYVFPGAPGA